MCLFIHAIQCGGESTHVCPSIHTQFSVVAKAGEGTYGIVYKAVSRKDPMHVVAIKEMRHDDQASAALATLRLGFSETGPFAQCRL